MDPDEKLPGLSLPPETKTGHDGGESICVVVGSTPFIDLEIPAQ